MRMHIIRTVALASVAILTTQAVATFGVGDDGGNKFTLPLAGFDGAEEIRDPMTVSAHFTAASADRPALLLITANIESGWHVYSTTQPPGGPQKTAIELTLSPEFRLVAPFRAHPAPRSHIDDVAWVGLEIQEHEGEVTWYAPIELTSDAEPSTLEIRGLVRGQACKDACVPLTLEFTAQLGSRLPAGLTLSNTPTTSAESTVEDAETELTFDARRAVGNANKSSFGESVPSAMATAEQVSSDIDQYELDQIRLDGSAESVFHYVILAFVGGLILNLMPCVLPVIGLKVMSFVEQAGDSRGHALALNVWYSAGIVSVFLLLGFLASWVGLSWGGQFSSTAFNVTLAGIVFAMALSLLGVWEIPIPGFLGSGAAQDLAAKEGPLGAFCKGVVTTVLATPCTGPFMATAIAWAITQPMTVTLTVFGSLGCGMASPYLLVGVFPQLLRFLPKPGAWMESFKHLMGFVLLGTVVFILTFLKPAAVVPSVALFVGIGVGCWMVSRTPLTAEFSDRFQSWALAGAVILLFSVVSFGWLYPEVMQPRTAQSASSADTDAAWQPFTLAKLKHIAVDQGRTVLVDFSAEWCLTCKTLEKTVLHTEVVDEAIESTDVVTMYADFTDYPAEIDRTIRALKSNGVPVIAVFPGNRPYEPIVFRGAYSQRDILEALAMATGRPFEETRMPANIAHAPAASTH